MISACNLWPGQTEPSLRVPPKTFRCAPFDAMPPALRIQLRSGEYWVLNPVGRI